MVEQRSPKPRVGGSSPSAPALKNFIRESSQQKIMANPFTKIRQFYFETIGELKKSNWPNFKEIRASMLLVFVVIILLGVFVAIADFSMYNVITLCSDLVSGKITFAK